MSGGQSKSDLTKPAETPVLQRVEVPPAGALPVLPPLARDAHGYALTALPEAMMAAAVEASGQMLAFVNRRYTRHQIDFAQGFDNWFAGLPQGWRDGLRRKAARIARESGGELDIRGYRTPSELQIFQDLALRISIRSCRDRLFGAGLPETPEFAATMLDLAAVDGVRAWLLFIAGEPAAYLYCRVAGDLLVHGHAGHDPAFDDWVPGAVLLVEALQQSFDEGRFAALDFGETASPEAQLLVTEGLACVDLTLLRPSLANRVGSAARGGLRRAASRARRLLGRG